MVSEVVTPSLAAVEQYRDQVYRRQRALKLRTAEDAARWVDEVGFAFAFPTADMEMPSLWQAVCGARRMMPENNDADMGRTWEWKDTLPAQRRLFYAKLLRGKPMLVALDRVPLFYALSENYGDLEDYLAEYEAGTLGLEAKKVYEALLEHGQAASTGVLRRMAGLDGKAQMARFDRAIAQLQRGMKIVKVGISDANRWSYSYVYDLLPRAFPEVPERARGISRREAQRGLLRQYVRNVGANTTRQVGRLFEWDAATVEKLAGELAAEGVVRGAVAGLGDDCLVWAAAFG